MGPIFRVGCFKPVVVNLSSSWGPDSYRYWHGDPSSAQHATGVHTERTTNIKLPSPIFFTGGQCQESLSKAHVIERYPILEIFRNTNQNEIA